MDQSNIASNKIKILHQSLYTFKESGNLEQALVNWHALPELDQMWVKAEEKINKKYADHRNHLKLEAR